MYKERLLNYIDQTQFTTRKDQEIKDYDTSIDFLVEFICSNQKKSKVFFIGNGGSAAIASHMTTDFMKNGGIKTCSLYNHATLTCLGNDYGYEYVFSKQLEMLCEKNDILVAISSSGNSKNIVNAIEVAKEKSAKIITFSGFEPTNTIRAMGDYNIYVPCSQYGIVESIHNMMLQQVVDEIMEKNCQKEMELS